MTETVNTNPVDSLCDNCGIRELYGGEQFLARQAARVIVRRGISLGDAQELLQEDYSFKPREVAAAIICVLKGCNIEK